MKRSISILAVVAFMFFLIGSTVTAQDFCKGNFDYDKDVDGTDAFTFKTDFGRSMLLNPCPADGPAPVSKTGQTVCYDSSGTPRDCAASGEDGEYQKGVVAPNQRFTDNGDGTVIDNLTGLIWLKNSNCFGARTWDQALADASTLADGSCGLADGSNAGDWRLPNVKELQSLIDFGQFSPALPAGHPFINQQSVTYWSSTTHIYSTGMAWGVYLYDGYVYYGFKTDNYYVWPVRGGH